MDSFSDASVNLSNFLGSVQYEAYYYSLASQQVCKSVEHNAHYHRTAFLIDPAAVHIKLTAPINETISGRKLWAVQL